MEIIDFGERVYGWYDMIVCKVACLQHAGCYDWCVSPTRCRVGLIGCRVFDTGRYDRAPTREDCKFAQTKKNKFPVLPYSLYAFATQLQNFCRIFAAEIHRKELKL